ncbi:SGNH/GDSL hydrolase family protein [Adlercreutzia sp. ZJ304]|uniref:SGNH/GDSL hydrolase family protein n=1 Tax=Adlercreutzia sp. ZJ304 TaxID=2709791 RepID=UPI0013EBE2ED|nr:SGNH/GDSL hydrolase family protein [Adlercreutzia sp. ZJ304]
MGKRISVFGDSISTFHGFIPPENKVYYEDDLCAQNGVTQPADTWWMQVIESLEGELLANGSFSGSLVTGSEFPAGRSVARAKQVIGASGQQPDCILIYMGINDYGEGSSLCEFEQAYAEMLTNLSEMAPNAEMFCMTLLPGRSKEHDVEFFRAKYKGENLESYNEAIRCVVKKYGAHLIDMANLGKPFDTLDGTHPTKLGMQQLAQTFLMGC